jgi:hypothetical protein
METFMKEQMGTGQSRPNQFSKQNHRKKFVNQAFQNSAAAGPNHVAGLAVAKAGKATKKKKAKNLA